MTVGAFAGDERRKQALLDELAALATAGNTSWLPPAISTEPVAALAARFDLHQAFVALLAQLAGGDPAVAATAIKALGAGVDSLDVVRAWHLWNWRGAPDSLADRLAGTVAQAPAAALIALVNRSRTGSVPAGVWRHARKALSVPADAAGLVFALPVTAMGWDLDASPQAAVDVPREWQAAFAASIAADHQWTDVDDAERTRLLIVFYEQAGKQTHIKTAEDAQAKLPQFHAAVAALWDADPAHRALAARHAALQAAQQQAQKDWLESARAGLVACASAAQ